MNLKQIIKEIAPSPIISYGKSLIRKQELQNCLSSASVSQAGQDQWVYGEVFNELEGGFFLDVGAHDGVYLSNTLILEKRYNWKGICVEGNPNTFLDLEASRNCKCINVCVDKQAGSVPFALRGVMGGIVALDCDNLSGSDREIVTVDAIPLQQLLCQEKAPLVIDYLSIDIEGAEDRALLEFDFNAYKFNCITIERPSDELRKLLTYQEYILIKDIPGLDCFYIHASFMGSYQSNLIAFHEKRFQIRRR